MTEVAGWVADYASSDERLCYGFGETKAIVKMRVNHQWDLPPGTLRRRWMEQIFRTPRIECLRRARVNLYLARRCRRTETSAEPQP